MSEKGLTTIALKKDKPFQDLPIHLPEQTNLQATDCPGSADGSVYCQPEFKSSGK